MKNIFQESFYFVRKKPLKNVFNPFEILRYNYEYL